MHDSIMSGLLHENKTQFVSRDYAFNMAKGEFILPWNCSRVRMTETFIFFSVSIIESLFVN